MLNAALAGAVRFRMLVLGLAAGLIVLGVAALPKMHNDVLPELSSGPVLEVQTEALGLSSQEVEQYVTVPIENNLLDGIMGVWNVQSDSIAGLSKVDLYFEPGTTELHARQLVEERLANAFSLPNVSKPPLLIQPLSTSSRALMVGLSSRTVDPLELSYLARWIVKPRLEGVPGVANVAIFGQQDREIQVQVDPLRLAQHHVTLQQVIDTAGNSQLVSPLSYLEGSAPGTGGFLEGSQQRLDIRPVLPLGAPRNLADVPIAGGPNHVSIGQVANVVEGHQPLIGDGLTRSGGRGLVLEIQKLPSASVVGVTNGVERALSELRPALAGVTIDTSLFKPATYVSSALDNLALAALIAAGLAILALIAMLLDLRAVCVAALSVAMSIGIALLIMQWRGQTLNTLVVLGLLVASVVLVDDAVGGTQELLRSLRDREAMNGRALSLPDTVIDAAVRLRRTLGYATLIVLLVTAPVFFSSGLTAAYLHPMMLSLALAVLASALIAMTVTPALCVLLFERWAPRRGRRGAVRAARLVVAHDRLLRAALKMPVDVLVVACLAGLGAIVALPFLRQPSPPRFKDRDLVVQWSGPAGAGLTEMTRITTRTLSELRSTPGVADAGATLGRAVSGDQIVDPSSGELYVALKPNAEYDQAVQQVREIVQGTPGVQGSVSTYEADIQSGVLAAAPDDVTVRVYGEDYPELRSIATEVQRRLATVRGLGRPQIRVPAQDANIEVSINDGRAQSAGVLPGDARRQASTYVEGLTVGNFFEDQAVFDVVVVGAPSLRANVGTFGELPIDTQSGGHVPLSSIASIAVRPDAIDIRHQALSRYVDVVAPVHAGGIGSARSAAQAALSGVRFPLTYHAEVLGGTPDDPTSHWVFMSYVFAALVGILLLLQAAFGSWRMATLFLLSIPIALTGGVLVALITGQARSLGADAGLLAVLLFAVRQGMLQVSAVRRQHRLDGGTLRRAIVRRAAAERLGSSLAAVAVSAVTLAPFIAAGDSAGNEVTHTAAAVMLGGLVTSTLWSHLLLPAICLRLARREPEAAEEWLDGLDPVGLAAPEPSLVLRGDH
jgi:Cu/Ag efflux pump CusA